MNLPILQSRIAEVLTVRSEPPAPRSSLPAKVQRFEIFGRHTKPAIASAAGGLALLAAASAALYLSGMVLNDVYDIEVSRRQPSLQLVGRPDRATLDLPLLQSRGVRLTGRVGKWNIGVLDVQTEATTLFGGEVEQREGDFVSGSGVFTARDREEAG